MTPNEILHEIQKLPLSEQAKIKQTLLDDGESTEHINQPITQKEMWQKLYEEGFITHIPKAMTDEEDDFEPIEIEGEPVSETIIRERR